MLVAGGITTTTSSTFDGNYQTFTGANYNAFWDKAGNYLKFNDNAKAVFGTGEDLQIYHTGSHSYIQSSTGFLIIDSDALSLRSKTGGEAYITGTLDGAVDLYYDGSLKAATNSGGFVCYSHLILGDDDIAKFGNGADLKIYHDGDRSYINNTTGALYLESGSTEISLIKGTYASGEWMLRAVNDGAVELYYDGTRKLRTLSTGVELDDYLYLLDGKEIRLGSGEDFRFYHNGTLNVIDCHSGNLEIKHGSEKMMAAVPDGQVELYYDSGKRLETTPKGLEVFGRQAMGNSSNQYPWSATGNVANGVLLNSEDTNVEFPISANANDHICCILNRTNGNGRILEFKYNGSVVGNIDSNASSLPSDRDFKKNISDLNLGLSLVNKLKPSQFNYKIDSPNTPVMYGLIAQEFEEAITSEGVTKNSTQLIQHHPTDDTESNYSVDYLKLVPILINSIKELSAEVETLKTKVAALEAK